jgi:C4-dicarboxylate-specific signal transduction histidine kinase
LPQSSEWQTPLGRIEQNSHRISAVIKSLQYFSRQGDQDPLETVSVSFIVDRALQINQQRFIKNQIELIVSEPPDAQIVARPVQIGQVLISLLNNAFESVLKSEERRIELKIQKKSEGVFFSVSKGIIQDHKGDLTFQSVPGRTTFEFFIPN